MKITRRIVLALLLFCSIAAWLLLLALERYYRAEENYSLIFVRTKRPEMRPNPAFLDLLSKWERAVNE